VYKTVVSFIEEPPSSLVGPFRRLRRTALSLNEARRLKFELKVKCWRLFFWRPAQLNFFGIKILTDPVLFSWIGIRLPGLTLGPKPLTASALTVRDLPKIDIVLLSHAHFDHFDMRTLHRLDRSTTVITAGQTLDLLRWTWFREVSELSWSQSKSITTSAGKIDIAAFGVKHWGARKRRDTYREYNGYVIEKNNRRIIFSGDTALSDSFEELRASGPIDLAIMPIGAYDPWIRSHCTPEQAVHMANEAAARFIMIQPRVPWAAAEHAPLIGPDFD